MVRWRKDRFFCFLTENKKRINRNAKKMRSTYLFAYFLVGTNENALEAVEAGESADAKPMETDEGGAAKAAEPEGAQPSQSILLAPWHSWSVP